ncbi:MAG: Ku protein, partial [Pyrinomonadaceae bacterium]
VYFERGYFLTPTENSEKAYKLLADAMQKTGQAGIATFVMRGKEHPVAIFSDHGILRAEVMRFPDEVRSPKDIGLPKKKKIPPATVRKFETLIGKKSKKTFSPTKLEDEQTERLLNLVKKKKAKRANVVRVEPEKREESNVIDMVQILKKSLSGRSK